jgi:methionyl aminopeptidase
MSIETPEDLERLRAAGRVVADAIREMRRMVRPGVSTEELDGVAGTVFAAAGARSGPQLDYDFPGVCCLSVNDEAVHGIPGKRQLCEGDLVKLDVTAELDGYYSDACVTVGVGRIRPQDQQLIATARRALNDAIAVARTGVPLNHIGATVERTVSKAGHAVCADLMGHGIGRRIHEPPHVPNHYVPALSSPLTEGLVMTIEPIISAGTGRVHTSRDGWTVKTSDGARAAHFEHTVVIARDRSIVLTAA